MARWDPPLQNRKTVSHSAGPPFQKSQRWRRQTGGVALTIKIFHCRPYDALPRPAAEPSDVPFASAHRSKRSQPIIEMWAGLWGVDVVHPPVTPVA